MVGTGYCVNVSGGEQAGSDCDGSAAQMMRTHSYLLGLSEIQITEFQGNVALCIPKELEPESLSPCTEVLAAQVFGISQLRYFCSVLILSKQKRPVKYNPTHLRVSHNGI